MTRSFANPPLVVAVLLCARLASQLPEHGAVVGTFSATNQPFTVAGPATPGLFFVDLPTATRPTGVPLPVTGLPSQLASNGYMNGVFSVLHRPSDGRLIVGDGAAGGGVVHVHVLTLSGSDVTAVQTVVVGTTTPSASTAVLSLSLFPDDRVLLGTGATSTLAFGPMAASPIGILDTSGAAPVLTPIPLSLPLRGEFAYGTALSRDGTIAWVVTNGNASSPPARLYRVDVDVASPTFGAVTRCHVWPREVVARLSLDGSGVLHATGVDPVTAVSTIYAIDASACPAAVMAVATHGNAAIFGPALEPADGHFVYASGSYAFLAGRGPFPNAIVWRTGQGTLTPLVSEPAGGWGVPFSLDVNRSIESYGEPSPGANAYRFVDGPNPGSVPQLGNLLFSLTVESSGSAGGVLSFALIGAGRANAPILGAHVLVTLLPPIAVPLTFSTGSPPLATVPLPIPNAPALRGASLCVQSVHLEGGPVLAASEGAQVTVF